MSDVLEVRCFCQRKPILAVCKKDKISKKYFVHVKSMRGDRINAEVIVTEGSVRVRCRECFRWHTVNIVHENVQSKPERLPESLAV